MDGVIIFIGIMFVGWNLSQAADRIAAALEKIARSGEEQFDDALRLFNEKREQKP